MTAGKNNPAIPAIPAACANLRRAWRDLRNLRNLGLNGTSGRRIRGRLPGFTGIAGIAGFPPNSPMISLPTPDGLLVALLVTQRCQLACSYCELARAEVDMAEELAVAVIEDLDRRLPAGRPLTLVWHGGEPLLRGLGFFRRMHGRMAALRVRRPLANVLQTNGLLLDADWLEFLAETGDFTPNVSMDGPEVVTGVTRGIGVAAYEALFAEMQRRGLPFGLSVAGSPELLAHREEALEWFRARGLERVGLTPYQATGPHRASPELFAELVLDAEDRPNLFGGALLQGIHDQRLRGNCRFSSFSGGCHRHVLCVDAAGGLFPCLRGKWSGLWSWGTVQGGGLDAWWAAQDGPPPFRPEPPEACSSCAWKDLCNGGCPSNAKAMNGGADRPDFYCASFQRLFAAADRLVLVEALAWVEARRAAHPH